MRAGNLDLEGATQSVIQDIYKCIQEFDNNSSAIGAKVTIEQDPNAASHFGRLIEAYQAIATTVLDFSVQSPRYGLLKDRQENGSFLVAL